jgi:hypothetical protein
MLKQIRKLCKPAYVYLVLSAITIILMMVQNAGTSGTYKVGMYQCPCDNTAGIFLGKAIYVAFWTFILNAVCKAGYKSVSWFLVLFPMILGAVLVGLVLMSGGIREGLASESASVLPDPPNGFFDGFLQRLINLFSNGRFATNREIMERRNAPKRSPQGQQKTKIKVTKDDFDKIQKELSKSYQKPSEKGQPSQGIGSGSSSSSSSVTPGHNGVWRIDRDFPKSTNDGHPATKDAGDEHTNDEHTYREGK